MSATSPFTPADAHFMRRALQLARRGEGSVEPNPMVGSVVVSEDSVVGEGWHQAFGGPHAEVHALRAAGDRARGSTLYVTLEPCCHTGKTPPCTEAVISAGVARVVVAHGDPHPRVSGGGVAFLRDAGITVDVGLLQVEAAELLAPFLSLVQRGRPWVIAKWAMTLDGKLASSTGNSQWISGPESRQVVHRLRGRVDAVMVGGSTARYDDPQLTARPPGVRSATRVVVSGSANLSINSQLVRTAQEQAVLCVISELAEAERCRQLAEHGVEVIRCGEGPLVDCQEMFQQLGQRQMTNVLVEGGSQLLGSLFDANLLDELHVFLAPKLIGGQRAPSPIGGVGLEQMALARRLHTLEIEQLGGDLYLHGRLVHKFQ